MPKQSAATHTPETLANIVKELRDAADAVSLLEESMKSHKFESLVVPAGTGELRRGVERIRVFGRYVSDAMYQARKNRGDFGATEDADNGESGSDDGKKRTKKRA